MPQIEATTQRTQGSIVADLKAAGLDAQPHDMDRIVVYGIASDDCNDYDLFLDWGPEETDFTKDFSHYIDALPKDGCPGFGGYNDNVPANILAEAAPGVAKILRIANTTSTLP